MRLAKYKTVVRGVDVQVIEETDYPFRDTIRLTVKSPPGHSPFRCATDSFVGEPRDVSVNGQVQAAPNVGSFARIDRTWKAG